MTGFTAFYRKELHEIVRTWRIWTLPGLVLFFAIASPILTVMMPAILSTVTAGQPGVVIRMPEPTAVMACQQFLKNLNQVVLIAVVLIAAGSIPNERRSGVAMLVLTKPLSRAGYVLAKLLSQLTLVVVAVIAGSGLCALITRLLFGDLPAGPFFAAIGLWKTIWRRRCRRDLPCGSFTSPPHRTTT